MEGRVGRRVRHLNIRVACGRHELLVQDFRGWDTPYFQWYGGSCQGQRGGSLREILGAFSDEAHNFSLDVFEGVSFSSTSWKPIAMRLLVVDTSPTRWLLDLTFLRSEPLRKVEGSHIRFEFGLCSLRVATSNLWTYVKSQKPAELERSGVNV
jgi:hypothetical protein